ncbi:MAG: M17 family peptidase N-terminal domain-containing protein, partial [Deltaproteobacteria bacterium]|nr:M17 family peptidase N-terminal domain-containing protein [Deltaproteobacteria bacterium]
MEFIVKKGKAAEFATLALVVPHCEEDKKLSAGAQNLDKKMRGLLTEVIAAGDFEGKLNQIAVIYTQGAIPAQRLILTGMGKRTELDREKLRGAFAKAAREIRGLNVKSFAVAWDPGVSALPAAEAIEAMVEGVYLGLYQFTPFKTLERDKIKEINEFTIIEEKEDNLPAVKAAVKTAETICRAVCFTRDLVSTPGNEMTP